KLTFGSCRKKIEERAERCRPIEQRSPGGEMAVCAAAGRLGRSLFCGLVASICLKPRSADCGSSARPVERLASSAILKISKAAGEAQAALASLEPPSIVGGKEVQVIALAKFLGSLHR